MERSQEILLKEDDTN